MTRQLCSVLVSAAPPVRLLDTPGLMVPRIESHEVGLKLALTGAIKDEVVGEEVSEARGLPYN